MRDRLLTPFIQLPWGEDPPDAPSSSPSRAHPARQLEGRVICDGRYLLLRKQSHDRNTVMFSARDMLSGLLVEVAVDVELDPLGRYRIGSTRIDETPPNLPNLLGLAEVQAAVLAEQILREEGHPGRPGGGPSAAPGEARTPLDAKAPRGPRWWRSLRRMFTRS